MHKLFNIKIDLNQSELTEKLKNTNTFESNSRGIHELHVGSEEVSGLYWHREEIVVFNEADISSTAEPITFFKVSRFSFKLRPISNRDHLLQIECSSKSIKPFLNTLQELTGAKTFISQIEISLEQLAQKLIESKLPLTTITHAYTTNQVISPNEKITFSIYSTKDAILAARAIIDSKPIKLDRIKIQTAQQGKIITLDIKNNCLYSVSEPNSEIERKLVEHVIETQKKAGGQ